MAGINPVPTENFGNLLSSFPQGMAQANASQGYANVANAQVPLIQQQTVGANIQNQMSQLGLDLTKQMFQQGMSIPNPFQQGQGGQSGPDEGPTTDDSGVAGATNRMLAGANRMYQPAIWTPEMQQQYNQLALRDSFMGKLGFKMNTADLYKQQYDTYNTARQTQASNDLQAYIAANKYGFAGIDRLQGGALATKLHSMGFTDDDVKNWGAKMAPIALQFSKEPTEYQNGELTLKGSGQPVPGVEKLPISPADATKLASETQTWYANNMEHTGSKAEYNGYHGPEGIQTYANFLSHNGTPPPALPGSQAAIDAQQKENIQKASKDQSMLLSPDKRIVNTSGMNAQEIAAVKTAPTAQGAKTPPNSNAKLNENQTNAFNRWQTQATAAYKDNSDATMKATTSLQDIQRLSNLVDTVDPKNLGPGGKVLTDVETFTHNWFGTNPTSASAQQVLTKVIGADQLNRILTQFHGEGAQVRLGAYETRIIMENLAANPQMTKEAIKQLLSWQGSDAQYSLRELNFERAGIQAGKEPVALKGVYESNFPRTKNTESALTAIQPMNNDRLLSIPMQTSRVGSEANEEIARMTRGQHYIGPDGHEHVKEGKLLGQ